MRVITLLVVIGVSFLHSLASATTGEYCIKSTAGQVTYYLSQTTATGLGVQLSTTCSCSKGLWIINPSTYGQQCLQAKGNLKYLFQTSTSGTSQYRLHSDSNACTSGIVDSRDFSRLSTGCLYNQFQNRYLSIGTFGQEYLMRSSSTCSSKSKWSFVSAAANGCGSSGGATPLPPSAPSGSIPTSGTYCLKTSYGGTRYLNFEDVGGKYYGRTATSCDCNTAWKLEDKGGGTFTMKNCGTQRWAGTTYVSSGVYNFEGKTFGSTFSGKWSWTGGCIGFAGTSSNPSAGTAIVKTTQYGSSYNLGTCGSNFVVPEAPSSACSCGAATPTPATPSPQTPVPETLVPETPVPETPVPETPVPETPVPETPVPETPVPETPVPDTPVPETPVPETPVPETPVPETPVPETPVPETPVPDTPVPETPVPETPVPETPVPETPVPETPVPETPVPETPVPETPVPETPVPETPVPETPVPETPVPETPVPETPVPETPAPQGPQPLTTGTTTNTPVTMTALPSTPTTGQSTISEPPSTTMAETTTTTTTETPVPETPIPQTPVPETPVPQSSMTETPTAATPPTTNTPTSTPTIIATTTTGLSTISEPPSTTIGETTTTTTAPPGRPQWFKVDYNCTHTLQGVLNELAAQLQTDVKDFQIVKRMGANRECVNGTKFGTFFVKDDNDELEKEVINLSNSTWRALGVQGLLTAAAPSPEVEEDGTRCWLFDGWWGFMCWWVWSLLLIFLFLGCCVAIAFLRFRRKRREPGYFDSGKHGRRFDVVGEMEKEDKTELLGIPRGGGIDIVGPQQGEVVLDCDDDRPRRPSSSREPTREMVNILAATNSIGSSSSIDTPLITPEMLQVLGGSDENNNTNDSGLEELPLPLEAPSRAMVEML